MEMNPMTNEQRFEENYIPEPNSGCWLWLGASNGLYGNFKVGRRPNRTTVGAHQFSYLMYKEPIPDGLEIDHICTNKLCVNPTHLQIVTRKRNQELMSERMIFCKNGHPRDNLYIDGVGKKHCRYCRRTNDKNRRPRR